MNWNEWTESYGDDLAEIKVQATLDLAHAAIVARYAFKILSARERIGYGVFKVSMRDEEVGGTHLDHYPDGCPLMCETCVSAFAQRDANCIHGDAWCACKCNEYC